MKALLIGLGCIVALIGILILGAWGLFELRVGSLMRSPGISLRLEEYAPGSLLGRGRQVPVGNVSLELPANLVTRIAPGETEGVWVVHFPDHPNVLHVLPSGAEPSYTEFNRSARLLGLQPVGNSVALQRSIARAGPVRFWDFLGDGREKYFGRITLAVLKDSLMSRAERVLTSSRSGIEYIAIVTPDTIVVDAYSQPRRESRKMLIRRSHDAFEETMLNTVFSTLRFETEVPAEP